MNESREIRQEKKRRGMTRMRTHRREGQITDESG